MKNGTLLLYIVGSIAAILILWVIERIRPKEEAFQSQQNIKFCPRGWKPYYDGNGDMACCEGTVKGNVCEGVPRCSFAAAPGQLASCTAIYQAYTAEKAKSVCPASMPNYFEGPDGGPAGCTAGALSDDLTGPAVAGSAATCRVYADRGRAKLDPLYAAGLPAADEAGNKGAADSCVNQRRLDAVACFGTDCAKSIQVSPVSKTALIKVDFTDGTGVRRSTVTRDSYKDYLDATRPGWDKTIDLGKSLTVTEVAKAVFVDRTMDVAQATV